LVLSDPIPNCISKRSSAMRSWRNILTGSSEASGSEPPAWRRDGVLARIVEALQVKLDNKGLIDWDLWCVDGSNVQASKSAAGAEKKSRP
jgi:hypothetical protein